jgi:hypothetical protein
MQFASVFFFFLLIAVTILTMWHSKKVECLNEQSCKCFWPVCWDLDSLLELFLFGAILIVKGVVLCLFYTCVKFSILYFYNAWGIDGMYFLFWICKILDRAFKRKNSIHFTNIYSSYLYLIQINILGPAGFYQIVLKKPKKHDK